MIPVSSSAVHSFSQAGSSSLGLMLAIIRVTWRTPPFAARRSNSSVAAVGGLGQHRHADQPVGRGGAELHQPVVVDAVAGDAQRRVVGRDLEDRAEDDLASATPSRSMSARRNSATAGRRALWS